MDRNATTPPDEPGVPESEGAEYAGAKPRGDWLGCLNPTARPVRVNTVDVKCCEDVAPRRDVRRLAIAQASLWCRGHGPAEARRRVRAAAMRWPAAAVAAAEARLDELVGDRTPALPAVAESPARDLLRRILGDDGGAAR